VALIVLPGVEVIACPQLIEASLLRGDPQVKEPISGKLLMAENKAALRSRTSAVPNDSN
jgi:hypothetical protein